MCDSESKLRLFLYTTLTTLCVFFYVGTEFLNAVHTNGVFQLTTAVNGASVGPFGYSISLLTFVKLG